MINVYLLSAYATTPGSNMASVQLPRKGVIKQIMAQCQCVLETDSVGAFQVRKNISTGTFGANASTPTGLLAVWGCQALLTTSGMSNSAVNVRVDLNEPVSERDTLFLHGSAIAGGTNGFSQDVLIYVDEP